MKMKKVIATVLTVATVFATFAVNTFAAERPSGTGYIGEWVPVSLQEGAVRLGDANRDGKIDQLDATYILRYVLLKDTQPWYKKPFGIDLGGIHYAWGYFPTNMDVNCDNKVDQNDATLLLRYVLWEDCK